MKTQYTTRNSLAGTALITVVSACLVGTVSAQPFWDGSESSAWANPDNWSAGIPNGVNAVINDITTNTPIISSDIVETPQELLVGSGSGANGALVVDLGSISVIADLAVGMNGGTGAMTVNGGAVTTGGWNRIGRDGNNSQGTLTMNGGSLTNGSFTFVGTGDTTGTLLLSGGNYINNGTFIIAEGNNANGLVTINNAASRLEVAGELWVGNENTGTTNAVLNLEDGEIAAGNWFNVGRLGGTGELNITGGVINKTGGGKLTVGGGAGSSGAINQSGGTINSAGTQFEVGQDFGGSGAGTYTLSGTGVGNFENVILGLNNSSGSVNLDGGELNTRQVIGGNGGRIFNFNGGTLRATTDEATFFDMAGGRANVRDGGAVIDSNGSNITIGQALLHSDITGDAPTDGGLTKAGTGTLTLNGTNNYNGATIITGGALALGSTGSIDNTTVIALNGGDFDVSAKAGGYTLNSGQQLTGTGTVIGGLTIDGELAVGASIGVMTFDDITLGTSALYSFEILGGGGSADLSNASGTLSLDGATLDLVQLGTFTLGDKFTLFGYGEFSAGGQFAGLGEGDVFTDGGGQWQISYADSSAGTNDGTGTGFVTITAVPEPTTGILIGAASLGLLARRRRPSR